MSNEPASQSGAGAPEDAPPTLSMAGGQAAARRLPVSIGHYRILRLIGEGGMGAVYEAEQDQPRRTVALKVIKAAWASPELLRRFEQEAEALARLHHPGIAQVYEAGADDTGSGPQPYFAMELIAPAERLTAYAATRHLNVRQRLELMAPVCDAVQHAHQRGIIHRDLKPGNILVDENGQPKILDFGVARITDSDAQATRQTDVGQIVGTLAYMSPEQALAEPLELDTRSDVYALGVILYELLAGRLPYELSRSLPEAVHTIREEDPAPLSSVSRAFRGDIETIVAKALEKEKGRRYASAAELAADIRRYLADEPIVARPPTTWYQLQKFARRHRALVAGVAAVFVALLGGIVASTWEAARAGRAERAAIQARDKAVAEKQRADTEAASSKAINDFLRDDLLSQAGISAQAQPDVKVDPDLKVRTALDRAASRIAGKFDSQPLVESAIRETMGTAYADLGLYPEAQRQRERALELRRRTSGEQHPDTLAVMSDLAVAYYYQGLYAQAEPLFTKALEAERRVLGPDHSQTLSTMNDLALLYHKQAKYAQAEPLLARTLEARRRVSGPENPTTLTAMNNLGLVYIAQGKYPQAESLFAQAAEIRRRVSGEEHPDTLIVMNNLAATYKLQGKYVQAEPIFARALAIRRRVSGEEHPDTLLAMSMLAQLYQSQGKYAQAEPLFAKALEIRRRVSGAEHPETLVVMDSLAELYWVEGRYGQAEALFVKLLEVQRRKVGEENPETLRVMNSLALLYRDQGRFAEAEPLLTRNLEIRKQVSGEEHPDTVIAMNNVATVYRDLGRYAQAESLFDKAVHLSRQLFGPEHPNTLSMMRNLAIIYAIERRYELAGPLFAKTLEARRRVSGEEHPETLVVMHNQALMYENQGRYAEAEALFARTLEIRRRVLGEAHPNTLASMASLGLTLLDQNKYAEAEPLLRSALALREKATPDAWQRFQAQSLVGASLAGQKKYDAAEPLLLSGFEGQFQRETRIPRPERDTLRHAGDWIVRCYQDWGKPEKAAEWRRKLSAVNVSPAKEH